MYTVSVGKVTFPVAPSNLQIRQKSRNRTVDLLDGTQAVVTRKAGLREYTAEFLIPGKEYPFAVYPEGFRPPEYFEQTLRAYAEGGEPVLLVIDRAGRRTSATVCVEDAVFSEDAKNGCDVSLNLTLRETPMSVRYGIRQTSGSYPVCEGDTLRSIAKKLYGDPARWEELYIQNAEVLDAAARAHGYADSRRGERLFAGTVLTTVKEVG